MRRFWDKVEKTDSCWLWTGYRNEKGYGIFRVIGGVERAHRFSYLLHYGEIPAGKMILHSCDNPSCVNPSHLYAGTETDNSRDREERTKPNRKGSNNGRSKLTEEQVREVLSLKKCGFSNVGLRKMFNVSYCAINDIVNRRKWKHVEL